MGLEEREHTSDMRDLMYNLPYYSGKQSDTDNLVKWVLEPAEILDILEHNLRGERPGLRRGEWVLSGDQMLNDMGVRKMMNIVSSHVNKVVIMSDFNEIQINKIMFFLSRDVRRDLFTNFEMYEISFPNLTAIKLMICDLIYAALMQARDGGARNAWSKIQRVTTSIIEDKTSKKGGWVPSQFSSG